MSATAAQMASPKSVDGGDRIEVGGGQAAADVDHVEADAVGLQPFHESADHGDAGSPRHRRGALGADVKGEAVGLQAEVAS